MLAGSRVLVYLYGENLISYIRAFTNNTGTYLVQVNMASNVQPKTTKELLLSSNTTLGIYLHGVFINNNR
jgi:hypothetical protein